MKIRLFVCTSFLLVTICANASPVLITGTSSDAYHSPAITRPSPLLGGLLLNFDSISTSLNCVDFAIGCPTFNPNQYASQGVTISSPDGLLVYPFSTQSGPNELYDNSSDGSANITIGLAHGASGIGIGLGLADSDTDAFGNPITLTLQALAQNGSDLGSAFSVTLPETGDNPGNGYFVVEDSSNDIYGLDITAPVTDQGGLAIDDLQVAPEPSSIVLLASGGMAFLDTLRRRKQA